MASFALHAHFPGVYELPRPREGPRAVDAFMIPLLDEEVAYEVLRYVP